MATARSRCASAATTHMAAASASNTPPATDVATATTTDAPSTTHVASASAPAHTGSAASTDMATHAWRAAANPYAAIAHGAA